MNDFCVGMIVGAAVYALGQFIALWRFKLAFWILTSLMRAVLSILFGYRLGNGALGGK